MTTRIVRLWIAAAVLGGLAAQEAAAWGPLSRRAITSTALQMLRRTYPDVFKADESNFEGDLIRGALDGPTALRESLPMGSDEALVNSIGAQINQLRHARQAGVGSYFAYRMGVLSALVGDYFMPFAGDESLKAQEIVSRIEADLDDHLSTFRYQPTRQGLQFIRYPTEYFAAKRKFFNDAEVLIAADYGPGGPGYDGYMKNGGQALFANAVEAITDVWNTVLAPGEGVGTASDEGLTWFLVDEIEYLLSVKKNIKEAEKVQELFMRVNRNDFEAFEKVADYFYAYGGDAGTDIGLRMWETSLTASGPERRRVLRKLAEHYMSEGREQFELAQQPNAPKDALEKARVHFLRALEYDRTSEAAANAVKEVNTAIDLKIEAQMTMMEFVGSAQEMMRKAEGAATQKRYDSALAMYDRAIFTFGQVSGEFEEQRNAANEGTERAKSAINRLINTVFDEGRAFLNQGDDLYDQKKFADAISEYKKVGPHVAFLNDIDLGPGQRQELDELVAQSKDSVKRAENEKRRADAATRSGGAQGAPGAAGGRGGAPPAALGGNPGN